jgi:hypothetical protein
LLVASSAPIRAISPLSRTRAGRTPASASDVGRESTRVLRHRGLPSLRARAIVAGLTNSDTRINLPSLSASTMPRPLSSPARQSSVAGEAERACGVDGVQLAARSPRSNTILAQRGARGARSEPERSVRAYESTGSAARQSQRPKSAGVVEAKDTGDGATQRRRVARAPDSALLALGSTLNRTPAPHRCNDAKKQAG